MTLATACGGDDKPDPGPDAAPDAPAAVDAPVPPAAFSMTGHVAAGGTPGAVVIAGWVVFLTTPDYVYKYGQGSATGASFTLSVPGVLPAEAQNPSSGTAAVIAEFPAGTVIADGKLPDSATPIGFAPDELLVYKPAGVNYPAWISAFPEGYSCGRCVRTPEPQDSLVPVACAEVTITHDLMAEGCNLN